MYIKLSLLMLVALLCFPISGHAKEANIAVVDIEKILSESKAGKSIQTQLNTRREAFQKEFSGRENDLVEAEQKLIEKKASISAEEFAVKRKEFEKKLLETRNLFQKSRNSLDKGLSKALAKLRSNIIQVTAEIAEEDNYQIVLTRDSVVIVEKEMDITDKVLARMNKKFGSIILDISK